MKADKSSAAVRRERLRILVDETSQSALSQAGRMSLSQIGQWLSGERNISEMSARRIEAAARKPVGWLDAAHLPDQVEAEVVSWNGQPKVVIPAGSVGVPMLAIAASMGRGEDQPPEDIITGTIALSSDWIAQQLRLDPARLRFINGYGDSMSPTFNSGDVLLVDTGATSVVVDGIYVLATDSRLFIKRVRERLDGRYEISSDNPLVKTVDELDGGHQVDVLGRVVWVWNGRKV